MSIEDAGEIHSCNGDGGFEGEAEGQRQHVAGFGEGGGAAEGGVGEAVVRMEEYQSGC